MQKIKLDKILEIITWTRQEEHEPEGIEPPVPEQRVTPAPRRSLTCLTFN